MTWTPTIAAAVIAVVALAATWRRVRVLRRQLARQQAAATLTDAAMCRDLTAIGRRLAAVQEQHSTQANAQAVIEAAERVVDAALARSTSYHPRKDPPREQ